MRRCLSFILTCAVIAGIAAAGGQCTAASTNNTADGQYHDVFKGQNALWKAVFTIDGTVNFKEIKGKLHDKGQYQAKLTVTYQKSLKDLQTVKDMNISCEGDVLTGGEEWKSDKALNRRAYVIEDDGGGSLTLTKDSIIKLTLAYSGKKQTIELNLAK